MNWLTRTAAISLVLSACGGSDVATTEALQATTSPTVSITTTTTAATTTTTTAVPPTTTTTLPPPGPARYRLEIENSWSESTHPGAVPTDAHFSWLAGATHDGRFSIWTLGEPATAGLTEMAETGRTDMLVDEVEAATGVASTLNWRWWFCAEQTRSSKCGDLTVDFDVDSDHPFVSLAAMIGPSPDWFVGVNGLNLLENGQWREAIVVTLFPYDGGTRTSNRFALFGPRDEPPGPISEVTTESGQLIGPQRIGTYAFTLIEDD